MADSPTLRNAQAQAITIADALSLHTGDPSGTGANELVDPAYERVEILSWTYGGDGWVEGQVAGDASFTVPANTEILWVGLWDGTLYLDKAPCYISTLDSTDIIEIGYVRYAIPVPEAAV